MPAAERLSRIESQTLTPSTVWLELLQGRVQQLADATGARTLVIKGPFAAELGLRVRSTSTDVDVLVDPQSRGSFLEGLGRLGWRQRPIDATDDVFPQHSTSVYHPAWPVDIDIHHRFPGLDGDDGAVFEALWAERVTLPAADVAVNTTGLVGTTLVLAVNALRSPWSERSQRELAELIARAQDVVSGPAVVEMATATRALAAARPFLESAFPQDCPSRWPRPSRTWYLYSLNRESASHRLIALRHSPPRTWPLQLWRALVPSRMALAATNLAALDATNKQLRRMRLHRALGVVRKLPTIIASYREFRRREGRSAR